MLKAAKAYLATQVTTTSQGQILLLLYESAMKNLRQAQEKIEERDYAAKGILISKALDIISELSSSLNVEKGGDLARNLHNLYFYCSSRLLKANLTMDVTVIDEVMRILDGIRSAYAEIIPGQEGRTPKPSTSAPAAGPRLVATPAPAMAPAPAATAAPIPAVAPVLADSVASTGEPPLSAPETPVAPVLPGPQVNALVNPLARRAQSAYAPRPF